MIKKGDLKGSSLEVIYKTKQGIVGKLIQYILWAP